MRARAAAFSSSLIRPRATWRARLLPIVSRACAKAAGLASLSRTSSPASAQTCAMPRPICPALMMPIRRISFIRLSTKSSFRGPSGARQPGIHEHRPLGYGFRARRCAPPRNDWILHYHLGRRRSLLAFPELLLELRQDLEQIADNAVIGDLEDRRLLVLVDRDDDLGVLHAGELLDRPRDADRDIEPSRHELASPSHLGINRNQPGIDRGPL